jgi:hypothetical protein
MFHAFLLEKFELLGRKKIKNYKLLKIKIMRKNLFLLTALGLFFTITSCKKDYVCDCDIVVTDTYTTLGILEYDDSYTTTESFAILKAKEDDALSQCSQYAADNNWNDDDSDAVSTMEFNSVATCTLN